MEILKSLAIGAWIVLKLFCACGIVAVIALITPVWVIAIAFLVWLCWLLGDAARKDKHRL